MGAPSETYVDPSIAANSGTGTIGDPYGDLQYALDQTTQDGTNGNRFNIKAGTAEILSGSLDLTTFGTGSGLGDPLIFRGYTSTAADGGIGEIDGNNGNYAVIGNQMGVHFIDMKVHNFGATTLWTTGVYCGAHNTEFADCDGTLVRVDGWRSYWQGCYFHDASGVGLDLSSDEASAVYNYFKNDGTRDFTTAIWVEGQIGQVSHNILSIGGTTNGIKNDQTASNFSWRFDNNSIFSSGGSGIGIWVEAGNKIAGAVTSNLIEGFSGVGGVGIQTDSGNRHMLWVAYNALYNNTTDLNLNSGPFFVEEIDNEALSVSPFDKSGSDTFANRFTYFAPANTGNVHGGAYPSGSRRDKGAVQHADPAGGGSGGVSRSRQLVGI